jgi:outer membrane lipoprotein-sorting protein
MKTIRLILLALLTLSFAGSISAQTADEIISKYVQAIGGKERLSKITSVYTEGTIEVMGMQGSIKTYTVNGKGTRQDIDINGSTMTNCFGEKDGWSINPMMGSGIAETMPEAQYNGGKDGIDVGGMFVDYSAKGYKAELLGNETIANANTFKLKITSPDNISTINYFDATTFYLVRTVMQTEMQGQMTESIITYSDYKGSDNYLMPYKMEMDMAGGQFVMVFTYTKLEIDKPIDAAIFTKPV